MLFKINKWLLVNNYTPLILFVLGTIIFENILHSKLLLQSTITIDGVYERTETTRYFLSSEIYKPSAYSNNESPKLNTLLNYPFL